ncbi:27248_t:CDS:2 [Gigaspora margarita]|uniref:27248_t:CDS:1 n=1 Tax=Gigaspora margarita TaxID=4874 RepID=A0ABM8VVG4_GIGMA|nr:27248_t:CDS:2 [Gigaspora margarita]
MAKKNNVFEEIQELIQQIKNEYEEGVDFKDLTIKGEGEEKGCEVGCLNIISHRLKNFCRKRFNFPAGVNDHLDYARMIENEILSLSPIKSLWNEEKKIPTTFGITQEKKNRKIVRFVDGYSMKFSKPFALVHFHPECAEKYFADKEQPNESSSRIKEKILRNLDKISLDPTGYLANAEIVKGDIEKDYDGEEKQSELQAKIRQVEIEGEEINLLFGLKYKDRQAIKQAIIAEIKQNPQD